MRRTWLFVSLIALCPLVALGWHFAFAQTNKPTASAQATVAKKLPITQVVLFNTGLGYFQREGEVEGDVRIDLSVPTSDVNDLLKSMLIENAGKPVSINYEGIEPIETKLKSFAVDLASNPSLGQLLNQARGEKVELTLESAAGGGVATPLTGTIVGMEAHFENQAREVHHLNVLCADGVRRVPLDRVQRVRFLDSAMEEEFRHALGVLSAGRADQRRLVSVHLKGEGKRKVKIGYVAETPIWKATYRLVLDGKDSKPSLQGWAIVENTSEEDWKDVRVVLVSGRPITFEMDLAQQLFMPRPKVDPEVYASLRPTLLAPTQGPPLDEKMNQLKGMNLGGGALGGLGFAGGGQTGNVGNNVFMQPQVGHLGVGGGMIGLASNAPPAFGPGGQFNRYQSPAGSVRPRLTYEELQERRNELVEKRRQEADKAKHLGSTLSALGEGLDDVVTNFDRIGEGFRYSVEPRVTLPRQRSGLVSVLNSPIALSRMSVYSPAIHPRFPLHAAKLKNSTGQHLMQGPVAVYDEGEYVGDCRLPDMQPGQERLLTFAMDLGVEVRPELKHGATDVTGVEANKGNLIVHSRSERATTYKVTNRSKQERLVVVDHHAGDWDLADDSEKPVETTRQTRRYEWKIAAGKAERKTVTETNTRLVATALAKAFDLNMERPPGAIDEALASSKCSAALKASMGKFLDARTKLKELRREIGKAEGELKPLLLDQERLVAAIPKLPEGSAAHKRVLARYDEQEAQVEKLQKLLAERRTAEQKELFEFNQTATTLSVK